MSKQDRSVNSIVPGIANAARVQKSKRHPNGDINRAIGKWKRSLKDSGVLESIKENRNIQSHLYLVAENYKKQSLRKKLQIVITININIPPFFRYF